MDRKEEFKQEYGYDAHCYVTDGVHSVEIKIYRYEYIEWLNNKLSDLQKENESLNETRKALNVSLGVLSWDIEEYKKRIEEFVSSFNTSGDEFLTAPEFEALLKALEGPILA